LSANTTDAAAPPAPANDELPLPLVRFTKHPLRWTINRFQTLVWKLVAGYAGLLIFAAIYYLLTQKVGFIHEVWHLVPDGLRHLIRDSGEGLEAGLLARFVVWDHYKYSKHRLKPMTWLDKLEVRLHISNLKDDKPLSFRPALTSAAVHLFYGIPGWVAVWLILHFFHGSIEHGAVWLDHLVLNHTPDTFHSPWRLFTNTITDGWERKVEGLAAAYFFAFRPLRGFYDDLQTWLSEWVIMNADWLSQLGDWVRKVINFVLVILAPAIRARIRDFVDNGVPAKQAHSKWWAILVFPAMLGGMYLAGYGAYVLYVVARR
jgi:hypothetical protein